MKTKTTLLKKISDKSAKIGIIGLGYVGLPLGLEFVESGFSIIGFDVDERKIPLLKKGETYIKHLKSERIKKAVDTGRFDATTDFSLLPEVDAIIICVPTPLDEHREPDMSYVVNTAEMIQKYLRPGQIVTLESTTYPGTTEEILLPLFESAPLFQNDNVRRSESEGGPDEPVPLSSSGNPESKKRTVIPDSDPESSIFTVGQDFFLAFSPEREDPNNPNYTTKTIPKVVGGCTENCSVIAKALYDAVIDQTVMVSSPRAAEATKLLENIYRSVNIALVNELKMVFHRMDIDIWEVIKAASTKPFGYHPFYPGPGLGGHCIPIDPFYLTWKAREYEVNTKFIELAGEINTYQPYYVVLRSMEILNDHSKSLKGAKVLILGAAYKKNIDDMRESPSLKLIEIFRSKGAEVDYNDPYVPNLPATRKYNYDLKSVDLSKESLSKYDMVLLSTDHDDYDYEFIIQNSKLVIDTRNAFIKHGIQSEKLFDA